MRFRKRYVEIDAEQYFLDKEVKNVIKLDNEYKVGDLVFVAQLVDADGKFISYVRESDWIVTNYRGIQKSYADSVVKEKYEMIEEVIEPHHNS